MKFCMVLEFFVPHYYGGGERRFYELTKRLVEQGHDVDVLTMKISDVADYEDIDGVNVYHIGPVIKNPPIRSKGDFIKYFFAVSRWLLTHNYDIIDAQSYSPLLPASLISKIKRTPMIGTIYDTSTVSDDQWVQSSKIASIAEKFLVTLPFTKILTISNSTKNLLVKYFNVNEEKIDLLYIGVNLEEIDGVLSPKKDEHTILFVGRLIPHKHTDHLLQIINNLKDEIPDIKLVIVGRGIEKDNLIDYVKENNLEEYVEFLQDLSNEELIIEMKKANILALPSTREGFGMVLSESNACYTPVVAYASGGVVEVVEDNVSGYLIEPENISKMQEKIEYILQNKEEEKRLSVEGRELVEERFNWDKIVTQYIEFSKNLIK